MQELAQEQCRSFSHWLSLCPLSQGLWQGLNTLSPPFRIVQASHSMLLRVQTIDLEIRTAFSVYVAKYVIMCVQYKLYKCVALHAMNIFLYWKNSEDSALDLIKSCLNSMPGLESLLQLECQSSLLSNRFFLRF